LKEIAINPKKSGHRGKPYQVSSKYRLPKKATCQKGKCQKRKVINPF
jgi:hypothetical protein